MLNKLSILFSCKLWAISVRVFVLLFYEINDILVHLLCLKKTTFVINKEIYNY